MLEARGGVSGSETVREGEMLVPNALCSLAAFLKTIQEMGDEYRRSFFSRAQRTLMEFACWGVVIPLWAVLDHHICLEIYIYHVS